MNTPKPLYPADDSAIRVLIDEHGFRNVLRAMSNYAYVLSERHGDDSIETKVAGIPVRHLDGVGADLKTVSDDL